MAGVIIVPTPNLKLDMVFGPPFHEVITGYLRDGGAKFPLRRSWYELPADWETCDEDRGHVRIVARNKHNVLQVVAVDTKPDAPFTNLWN